MHVEIVNIYNIHEYTAGIMKCLEDGFGSIEVSEQVAISVLLAKIQAGHNIIVTIQDDKVVATATGFVEQKLIHAGSEKHKAKAGSFVMHIEDVATKTSERGNGYGAAAVEALQEIAYDEGCYKIILDASVGNYENFYSRLGYHKSELCLRKNI